MRLSKSTIEILKHCAKINSGIVLNPTETDQETGHSTGKAMYPPGAVRTITSSKSVVFEASLNEVFPADTAIYNLSSFLAEVSETTEIEFTPERYLLRNGRSVTRFARSDRKLILMAPKTLTVSEFDEKLFLHVDDLADIFKKGDKLPNVAFRCDGKNKPIYVERCDALGDNPAVRSFECKVPRNGSQSFSAMMRVTNALLLKGSYEVELSNRGASRWTWLNGKATLWIATEAAHTWYGKKQVGKRHNVEQAAEDKTNVRAA